MTDRTWSSCRMTILDPRGYYRELSENYLSVLGIEPDIWAGVSCEPHYDTEATRIKTFSSRLSYHLSHIQMKNN